MIIPSLKRSSILELVVSPSGPREVKMYRTSVSQEYTDTLKNPTKWIWSLEPDHRSNFFSLPAHLCAVTYMSEIPLIVTLNNQFTSPDLDMFYIMRSRNIKRLLLIRIPHFQVKWIDCLTSQLTMFQSYMWRHNVQTDWRRSWTYGQAPNAIDIS